MSNFSILKTDTEQQCMLGSFGVSVISVLNSLRLNGPAGYLTDVRAAYVVSVVQPVNTHSRGTWRFIDPLNKTVEQMND